MLGVKLEFGRVTDRKASLIPLTYWHLSVDHDKITFPLTLEESGPMKQ